MEYLADTVAIIRHFASVGKIGKAAKSILRDGIMEKTKYPPDFNYFHG